VAELERDAVALAAGDADATTRAIRMAVQLKARIVTEDEHETGSRRLLNLGHTIGHAIEAAAGYRDVRHGEAVALGMMAAFRVAAAIGRPSPPSVERMARLLDAVGLPTDPTLALNDHTLRFVASDKKRAGEHVRFVVPGAPGKTEIVPLRLDAIRAALVP
jgi:3-dehydroquinate synthetase